MGELKCNFTCVFIGYITTFWRYKESNELGTKTKQQANNNNRDVKGTQGYIPSVTSLPLQIFCISYYQASVENGLFSLA